MTVGQSDSTADQDPSPGVSSAGEVSSVGVVEDLVQARTDYERGDWTAALDVWSDVEPER